MRNEVSVVVDEVHKILCMVIDSDFVHECRNLEADSSPNRKPVQFFKDWFDMALTACTSYQLCKAVQDTFN